MNVICPRCELMEPQILIAAKINQLCDKCGNALINVTERIDPPPMAFSDGKKPKKDKTEAPADAVIEMPGEEVSDKIINKMTLDADDDTEILEVMPDLEKMTEKKLRELGKDLDVPNYWNRHLDDLKELIQVALDEQATG